MIDDGQDKREIRRAARRDRPEFLITRCPGGFTLSEDGMERGWYRTEGFAAAAAVTAAQDRKAVGYLIHYP